MRHYDLITVGLEVLRVTHNSRWGAVYLKMIFGVWAGMPGTDCFTLGLAQTTVVILTC